MQYFKSDYENWTRFQVRAIWSSAKRSKSLHLIQINHYLKWCELILIQSKEWINFDPVLRLDHYTSSGIHVSKIKQYCWLICSWIINEFEMLVWKQNIKRNIAYIYVALIQYLYQGRKKEFSSREHNLKRKISCRPTEYFCAISACA
jgi:hypothetical protein